MSALRETTPGVGSGNGVPVSGRSPQPRRPTAARPVGAAGAQRRSLQRDLARREANIRISRRVSGAAAGVSRPPLSGQAPAAVPSARSTSPQQRVAAPTARGPQQAPARVVAPQAQPSRTVSQGTAPQSRAAITPHAARPMARVAPAGQPAAPYGVGQAAALAAALAEPGLSAPKPQPAVPRPILTTLPGGAPDASLRKERRLSNPAVLVAAFVILVLTVGAIVALQIRMTQINEAMGSDLGKIAALQQANTAAKESIARQGAAARVDSAATAGGLMEPDVTEVTYLRSGDRAATAAKAARNLKDAPLAPTAAQTAAASAQAATTTQSAATAPTAATAQGSAVAAQGSAAATTSGQATTAGTGVVQ